MTMVAAVNTSPFPALANSVYIHDPRGADIKQLSFTVTPTGPAKATLLPYYSKEFRLKLLTCYLLGGIFDLAIQFRAL